MTRLIAIPMALLAVMFGAMGFTVINTLRRLPRDADILAGKIFGVCVSTLLLMGSIGLGALATLFAFKVLP
jgi:hypothetical protein